MKKLMALCLSVLMVLSMCSFTVMAEDEAAAVSFEDISNGQLQNFILSDLAIPEGATVTSSNEVVISTTGKVTRPIYDDAVVTLTVNGTSFEVTVKAKTVSSATEAVTFEDKTADTSLLGTTGWTAALSTETAAGSANVLANGTDNYACIATTKEYEECVYTFQNVPSAENAKYITLEFDLAYLNTSATFQHHFYINDSKAGTIVAHGANNFSYDLSTGQPWYSTVKEPYTTGGIGADNFKRTVMKVDVENRTVSFSMGGTSFASYDLQTSSIDLTNITSIKFATRSRNNKGAANSVLVDNMIAYVTVDDAVALESATPAEKMAQYSYLLDEEYVANGGSFSGLITNLKFTADETLPSDVALTWTSTNAAVSTDGTVKRPFTEAETATITGTLSCGELTATKTYDVTILPMTVSSTTEILDAENHAVGDMFITADGWTPKKYKKEWDNVTILQESNGNKYYRVSSDSNSGGVAPMYTFTTFPSEVKSGETLVFEGRVKAPQTAGLINYSFYLNNNSSEVAEFIWWNGNLYDQDYDYGYDNYHGVSGYRQNDVKTKADHWYKIRLEIYADTESENGWSVKCYIDDALVGQHKTYVAVPATITSITYGTITRYNLNSTSDAVANSFDYDDIKVYTKSSVESVLSTLSDSDKVTLYKELIEKSDIGTVTSIGDTLDLDNGYADYDPAAYGVSVNWTSNNTEYITNDGALNKFAGHGTSVAANMTATITAGEVSDTVAKTVSIPSETTLVKKHDYSDTSVLTGDHAEIITYDEEHGNVLHMNNSTQDKHLSSNYNVTADGTTTSYGLSGLTGGGRGDRFIFNADIKYENRTRDSYGGIAVKTYAGANGLHAYLSYGINKVVLRTTEAVVNQGASGYEIKENTKYYPMPASVVEKGAGEWVNLKIDHNALSQTYSVYLDGILITDIPMLQAAMDLGSNGSYAIRGYTVELSNVGEIWVDNVELYNYVDSNAEEVNAALNAALIDYASEYIHPVLTNCQLPAYTIGTSWINGDAYDRDLSDEGAIKPTNVATYKYVEDGPAITWTVDGVPAKEINVASPKTVTITVTATKNGISESKTFARKVAPVAIRGLALGTESCLNGAWLEGATGTEKAVVAQYLGNQLVSATVIDFAETGTWDATAGTGSRFNTETGILHDVAMVHPNKTAEYDQIKIFVIDADGITPLATANTELHD